MKAVARIFSLEDELVSKYSGVPLKKLNKTENKIKKAEA